MIGLCAIQAVVSDVTNRQAFVDLGGLPITVHTLLQTCPEVPPAPRTPPRLWVSRLELVCGVWADVAAAAASVGH